MYLFIHIFTVRSYGSFAFFFLRQTYPNLIVIHLLYFQWRGKTRTYVYICWCVCCICLRSPSWKMPVQFPVQNSCLVPIRTVIYIFSASRLWTLWICELAFTPLEEIIPAVIWRVIWFIMQHFLSILLRFSAWSVQHCINSFILQELYHFPGD